MTIARAWVPGDVTAVRSQTLHRPTAIEPVVDKLNAENVAFKFMLVRDVLCVWLQMTEYKTDKAIQRSFTYLTSQPCFTIAKKIANFLIIWRVRNAAPFLEKMIEAKVVLNIKPHVLLRISVSNAFHEEIEFIFNFAIWAKLESHNSEVRVRRDVMNDACLKAKVASPQVTICTWQTCDHRAKDKRRRRRLT